MRSVLHVIPRPAALSALLAAGFLPGLPAGAETNPLTRVLEVSVPGGLAVAAVCLNWGDPADGAPNGATLVIDGIPAGASVQHAWLYWSVLSDATPVPAGSPTWDGGALVPVPVGEVDVSPCEAPGRTGTFRADVTALVAGDGSHRLDGFPGTGTAFGDWTEGATLFVVYCAPGSPEVDVVIYEGADVTMTTTRVFVQELSGFVAAPSVPVRATLAMAAGNGQSRDPLDDPDPVILGGIDFDALDPSLLSGALCPDLGRGETGQYDRTVIDVTGAIPPGSTSAALEVRAIGDCHSIAAVALAVETTPGSLLPEPSPIDLRPAAEPLRVVREPAGGVAVRWEDVGAATYNLHRGRIGDWYSHEPAACALTAPGAMLPPEPGDHYYLAVSVGCGGGESPAGRDSSGMPRPSALAASGLACP